jgi:hypothetical protein
MKDAKQLKEASKNLATTKNISSDVVLHTYMLERLLERTTLTATFVIFLIMSVAPQFGLETLNIHPALNS